MPSPAERAELGMILKGFPRISETFISNEIRLLERMGLAIRIFSMRKPRENFTHKNIADIRAPVHYLPENLMSRRLPEVLRHNLLLAARRPERYALALRTAARRFRRTRKSATWKHLLQAGLMVNRWLPGSGVRHLHAHFAHSPTSVAMFAAMLSGLPYSFTAHAKDIYTSDPRQLREKIAAARFVVTCTEYNRRYLAGIGTGIRTPVFRIYHGIDHHLFDPESGGTKIPSEPYRLLTIARLTPKKGIGTVLDALKIMKSQGIQYRHFLVGDGDDRDQVLRGISDRGLSDRVRWLGTQPHHVVLDLYRQADLFLIGCEVARNGDRDGIPNVLVESLAMGVPVVATDVSAIPELIDNGKTGVLVPPGDAGAMARASLRVLTDSGLRGRIIPEGRNRVMDLFDNKINTRELARVFRGYAGIGSVEDRAGAGAGG
ncbi:MAG: glycosyltransferase family 4 protein [Desulfobacterales bacterium]